MSLDARGRGRVPRRTRTTWAVWTALTLLLLVAAFAPGDRVVLRSGQHFDGRVVAEDPERVVFEIHMDGMLLKRTFPRGKIASLDRKRLYRPTTYFVIPIRGHIGTEVTGAVLRKCLAAASNNLLKVVPTVVILDIDSTGGDLGELLRLLEALQAYPRLRIAAYVRTAASAAAVLAMSCKEIVVAPSASIGGTVVYRWTPQGTPENIEEKMQSYWRARFRTVAAKAGHNPLLVEGMMRTEVVLGTVTRAGRADVVAGPGEKLLKPAGTILTLTAGEAVACGLALGTAASPGQCHRLLGLGEWDELLPGTGERLFDLWRKELGDARKRFAQMTAAAVALYDKAIAAHPNRFTYTVDGPTGQFTPESKTQWQQRSAACCGILQQAEGKLAGAEKIAETFPLLRLPAGRARELRLKCARTRAAVAAVADRPGRRLPAGS